MAGDDAVRRGEEGVIRSGRLFVEDVGAVSANLAAGEGGGDVVRVDQLAPGAVKDDDAVFHLGDFFRINHAVGVLVEEAVQAHDIRAEEDVVHRLAAGHAVFGGEGFVKVGVVGDHGHAESARAGRDFFADAAEADDAHG